MATARLNDSTVIVDGELTPAMAMQIGMSGEGCPKRGTLDCLDCAYADTMPEPCDFKCVVGKHKRACPHRDRCCCGWADPEKQRMIYELWQEDNND